jgi:hypothetical protein
MTSRVIRALQNFNPEKTTAKEFPRKEARPFRFEDILRLKTKIHSFSFHFSAFIRQNSRRKNVLDGNAEHIATFSAMIHMKHRF